MQAKQIKEQKVFLWGFIQVVVIKVKIQLLLEHLLDIVINKVVLQHHLLLQLDIMPDIKLKI